MCFDARLGLVGSTATLSTSTFSADNVCVSFVSNKDGTGVEEFHVYQEENGVLTPLLTLTDSDSVKGWVGHSIPLTNSPDTKIVFEAKKGCSSNDGADGRICIDKVIISEEACL